MSEGILSTESTVEGENSVDRHLLAIRATPQHWLQRPHLLDQYDSASLVSGINLAGFRTQRRSVAPPEAVTVSAAGDLEPLMTASASSSSASGMSTTRSVSSRSQYSNPAAEHELSVGTARRLALAAATEMADLCKPGCLWQKPRGLTHGEAESIGELALRHAHEWAVSGFESPVDDEQAVEDSHWACDRSLLIRELTAFYASVDAQACVLLVPLMMPILAEPNPEAPQGADSESDSRRSLVICPAGELHRVELIVPIRCASLAEGLLSGDPAFVDAAVNAGLVHLSRTLCRPLADVTGMVLLAASTLHAHAVTGRTQSLMHELADDTQRSQLELDQAASAASSGTGETLHRQLPRDMQPLLEPLTPLWMTTTPLEASASLSADAGMPRPDMDRRPLPQLIESIEKQQSSSSSSSSAASGGAASSSGGRQSHGKRIFTPAPQNYAKQTGSVTSTLSSLRHGWIGKPRGEEHDVIDATSSMTAEALSIADYSSLRDQLGVSGTAVAAVSSASSSSASQVQQPTDIIPAAAAAAASSVSSSSASQVQQPTDIIPAAAAAAGGGGEGQDTFPSAELLHHVAGIVVSHPHVISACGGQLTDFIEELQVVARGGEKALASLSDAAVPPSEEAAMAVVDGMPAGLFVWTRRRLFLRSFHLCCHMLRDATGSELLLEPQHAAQVLLDVMTTDAEP